MSDTLQYVQWALEWSCALRTGNAIYDIKAAGAAVSAARAYGESLARRDGRFGIFGDVYVESVHCTNAAAQFAGEGKPYDYPETGYIISEKFGDVGGPDGLHAMCSGCAANSVRPFPAGCVGNIALRPWCGETQECLAAAVPRLGLQDTLTELFVPTMPIWFGLWAQSPLSERAAGVLATLLTALHGSLDSFDLQFQCSSIRHDIEMFISAARIAESGTAKLHVRLPPPGHVDLGWYTIFPHCPLCKAAADLKRWQHRYPAESYHCKVCGTDYSPTAQASSEPHDFTRGPELRDVLGDKRFRAFAKDYLVRQGMPEADAIEKVQNSEAAAIEQKKEVEANRRKAKAREQYIEQSLYLGLRQESIADPDHPGKILGRGFAAADFEELMRRCAQRGIRIMGLSHHSMSEQMDRHELPIPRRLRPEFDPVATFKKWRTEGCNELFEPSYLDVPEKLIKDSTLNNDSIDPMTLGD